MDIIVIETTGVQFSDVEKYLRCVSKGRQASVMKKSSDEHKVLSLVAALLVRSEISRRTGIPAKSIVFEKGAHGKPYIKGTELQFSISHTDGAVCAAFSENGEIGIDIERRDRKVSENIRSRVLSENERRLAVTSEDIIRIWVKKEAFLKRTGIGIATQLCGADTTLLPDICAFEMNGYLIGAAGKDSDKSDLREMKLSDLLKTFDT